MEIWVWLSQNWFDFFSVVGIVAGLWYTAFSLRSQTKTQQVANLLTITSNHREIWKEFFHNPDLARVLNPAADLAKCPVTHSEEIVHQPGDSASQQCVLRNKGGPDHRTGRSAAGHFEIPLTASSKSSLGKMESGAKCRCRRFHRRQLEFSVGTVCLSVTYQIVGVSNNPHFFIFPSTNASRSGWRRYSKARFGRSL
jgi:hypothetical protein